MTGRTFGWLAGVMGVLVLAQLASAGEVGVQLRSNKQQYICGEPVLLQTSVLNVSGRDFQSKGFGWGSGRSSFTVHMAFNKENYFDIRTAEGAFKARVLDVSTAPTHHKFFRDRYWLPGKLAAGEQARRVDILILSKPGQYKLKTALVDGDEKHYVSNALELRVVELGVRYDSISKLGGNDFAVNLGSTIFYAHYVEELLGGYAPGESLTPEAFEKVAPVIIEKHKDSVFREYVMYADLMTSYVPEKGTSVLSGKGKELAARFIKEYPGSWLLPEVYRKLFFTYAREKENQEAEAVRQKVLKLAPDLTVLRRLRKYQLAEQE